MADPGTLEFDCDTMDEYEIATALTEELERTRRKLADAERLLWMIVRSNDGYILERQDMEQFPAGRAIWRSHTDPLTGALHLFADEQLEKP